MSSQWFKVGAILGGFGLVAVSILVLAWPGYQLSRHTALAEVALANKDYQAAAEHLRYITGKYPSAWVRLTQLGDCYLELEQPEKALDAYKASLDVEPKQEIRAKTGRGYFLLGMDDQATRLLQNAIDTNPDDPYANYYIGLLYMKQKSYARASFFLQGATVDPDLFEKTRPLLKEIRDHLLAG